MGNSALLGLTPEGATRRFVTASRTCRLQTMRPALLVEVHQHLLLEFALPVADGNRVVVTVEAVDECLYRWLVEVSDHGRGLRDRGEKSERSMAVGPTRQIYLSR